MTENLIGPIFDIIRVVIGVTLAGITACGVTEFIKKFLPESWRTGWKITLVSGLVGVVAGVAYILMNPQENIKVSIVTVLGTIAASTLFYETVVKLIKKIEDFLKSKTNK